MNIVGGPEHFRRVNRRLTKPLGEIPGKSPGKLIADPACGTGGFFLAAKDFIADSENFHLDKEQKEFLKHRTFHGNEIGANTRRLCLMNLFLHNIGEIDGDAPISPRRSSKTWRHASTAFGKYLRDCSKRGNP